MPPCGHQILRNGANGSIDVSPLDWSKPDAIPHFAIDASNTLLLEHEKEHFSHPGEARAILAHDTRCYHFYGVCQWLLPAVALQIC